MKIKQVYFFGGDQTEGKAGLTNILGIKGANLAEMARMGIPVPPGFIITTSVSNIYRTEKKFPEDIKAQVEDALKRTEAMTGTRFGDAENPLLVSVRSGASVSMPGMMDTVLNLGLNDASVRGLARLTSNERFAYSSYQTLIEMFGSIVLSIDRAVLNGRNRDSEAELTIEELKQRVQELKTRLKEASSKEFPQDPRQQLWEAISAVFASWNTPRAVAYRQLNRIPDDLGTAVVVQTMVFGNMGDDSGTGVVFSRNPATGEKGLSGEFLLNAQGEDIVAGIRTPQDIKMLEKALPQCYRELDEVARKLERHFQDMQDIEFTVQKGKLWMLQTRTGKRTSQAAIKTAVQMTKEGLIQGTQALSRISPKDIETVLHPTIDPSATKEVVARGLGASPGVASGKISFDPDEVVRLAGQDGDFILVREESSADDIKGMSAAKGVLTTRGGVTSHAAVVARGMGRVSVVGCSDVLIDWDKEELIANHRIFGKGDVITLDGSTGEVLAGKVVTIPPQVTEEFKELMVWEDLTKRLGVLANADNAADARLARSFGAGGIGLCRTEHMFFQADRIDHFRRAIIAESGKEKEEALSHLMPLQKADFLAIFQEMEGLPVTIRLLDPPLHEFLPLPYDKEQLKSLAKRLGISFRKLEEKVMQLREFNPMLGHRGCRLGITSPEVYRMQVRAILEAAYELASQGVRIYPEIMLPLIADVEEVKFLKGPIIETCEQVRKERKAAEIPYKLGIMIELPRACLVAEELAKLVDFFSFGTNDLTQTAFGISRDDVRTFLPYYLEKDIFNSNPFVSIDQTGVAELVKMGYERGKKGNPDLKVGICGEHGGDPKSIKFFHNIGLDYISCSPYRVPVARLAASQAALGIDF